MESVLWNGWPDLWTMATGSLLLCGVLVVYPAHDDDDDDPGEGG